MSVFLTSKRILYAVADIASPSYGRLQKTSSALVINPIYTSALFTEYAESSIEVRRSCNNLTAKGQNGMKTISRNSDLCSFNPVLCRVTIHLKDI